MELKVFLLTDTNNQPESMWAIVRDITERKRAEEELKRFFDLVPDLVCIASTDGRFLKINSAWQQALGYTEQEILATPFLDLIHPDDRNATIKEVERQMAGEQTMQFVNRYCCKDGSYRWLEWRASPAVDKKLLFASARDITEHKRVNHQLQELSAHLQNVREEEKACIAREIHDDLGGTLTALKLDVYRLSRGLSPDNAAALKRVDSMSQLLDSAVNVTRRIITDLRPAMLDDLGLLATLEWQADQFQKRTGIICQVNCVEDKSTLDKRYSIALFRIFQETLTNIMRHSGASRVEVEYHCDDEEVMLAIIDNGRGMPEGHAIAPTSYGLRSMSERTEQLGGNIRYGDLPGGGFNVTVILPLHDKGKQEETS